MKHFLLIAVVSLVSSCVNSQATTIRYSAHNNPLPNPDRGFYVHTEAHSNDYYPLTAYELNTSVKSKNFTLILRVFYLENFVKSDISIDYLSKMQTDFNTVRTSGLKMIVRFAYSDKMDSAAVWDTDKARVLGHINQLKNILNQNSDVICVIQAGFIGSWGEWYYTKNFGYPEPNSVDNANRREVVNALLNGLTSSRMVQIRTPALKRIMLQTSTALTRSKAYSGSSQARLGHHNDCFLADATDFGTYDSLSVDYPYLEAETKFLPMGGETCALNRPRSQCAVAQAEMKKFHWSYLNSGYHPSVLSDFKSGNCWNTIRDRLGYRFVLNNATLPTTLRPGQSFSIILSIANLGYAAPFNQRKAYLILRNQVTNVNYPITLITDPRYWEGSTNVTVIEPTLVLPTTVPLGSYGLFLNLPESSTSLANRPEYSIQLANMGVWEAQTGYNNLLHTLTVQ